MWWERYLWNNRIITFFLLLLIFPLLHWIQQDLANSNSPFYERCSCQRRTLCMGNSSNSLLGTVNTLIVSSTVACCNFSFLKKKLKKKKKKYKTFETVFFFYIKVFCENLLVPEISCRFTHGTIAFIAVSTSWHLNIPTHLWQLFIRHAYHCCTATIWFFAFCICVYVFACVYRDALYTYLCLTLKFVIDTFASCSMIIHFLSSLCPLYIALWGCSHMHMSDLFVAVGKRIL